MRAVLSLGSNLGDRAETIRAAVREIAALPGVTVSAASGLVETPAVKTYGVDLDAPAYLNAIVLVATKLEPHELLAALHGIEHEHGRVRAERWGDRTLDIDLIDFGGRTLDEAGLVLPHPRAFERDFVLAPWVQVDPGAVLAGYGRIDELLAATEQTAREWQSEPLL